MWMNELYVSEEFSHSIPKKVCFTLQTREWKTLNRLNLTTMCLIIPSSILFFYQDATGEFKSGVPPLSNSPHQTWHMNRDFFPNLYQSFSQTSGLCSLWHMVLINLHMALLLLDHLLLPIHSSVQFWGHTGEACSLIVIPSQQSLEVP